MSIDYSKWDKLARTISDSSAEEGENEEEEEELTLIDTPTVVGEMEERDSKAYNSATNKKSKAQTSTAFSGNDVKAFGSGGVDENTANELAAAITNAANAAIGKRMDVAFNNQLVKGINDKFMATEMAQVVAESADFISSLSNNNPSSNTSHDNSNSSSASTNNSMNEMTKRTASRNISNDDNKNSTSKSSSSSNELKTLSSSDSDDNDNTAENNKKSICKSTMNWLLTNYSVTRNNVNGPLYSDTHIDGNNCKWRFIFYPNGEKYDNWISLFIEIPEADQLPFGWSRNATFTITLINQLDETKNYTKSDSHVFKLINGDVSWGWIRYIECDKLAPNGYLVNNQLEIKADISLEEESTVITNADLLPYLCTACSNSDVANVKRLLSNNSNESIKAIINKLYKNNAPLHNLCMSNESTPEILRLLLPYDLNINLVNDDDETGLLLAAYYGHTSLVKELIKLSANCLIGPSKNGLCALGAAAQQGESGTLKLLIKYDAPLNGIPNCNCCAPLKQALELKQWKCAEILIRAGCSLIAPASTDDYLLFTAKHGTESIINILMDHDTISACNSSLTDSNGDTALAILVERNYTNLALKLLKQYNASVSRCSKDRKKVQRVKLLLTLEEKKWNNSIQERKQNSNSNSTTGDDVDEAKANDLAEALIQEEIAAQKAQNKKALKNKKKKDKKKAKKASKKQTEDPPEAVKEDKKPSSTSTSDNVTTDASNTITSAAIATTTDIATSFSAATITDTVTDTTDVSTLEQHQVYINEETIKPKATQSKSPKMSNNAKTSTSNNISLVANKKASKKSNDNKFISNFDPSGPKEQMFVGNVTKVLPGYCFINFKIYCARSVYELYNHFWPPPEGDTVNVKAVYDASRNNWKTVEIYANPKSNHQKVLTSTRQPSKKQQQRAKPNSYATAVNNEYSTSPSATPSTPKSSTAPTTAKIDVSSSDDIFFDPHHTDVLAATLDPSVDVIATTPAPTGRLSFFASLRSADEPSQQTHDELFPNSSTPQTTNYDSIFSNANIGVSNDNSSSSYPNIFNDLFANSNPTNPSTVFSAPIATNPNAVQMKPPSNSNTKSNSSSSSNYPW